MREGLLSNCRKIPLLMKRVSCAFFAIVFTFAQGINGQAPSEYQIKAAFLYNFTKFVSWPPQSFSDANAAFVIGVLGDIFCPMLDQTLAGKKVNGHPISIKRLKLNSPLQGCHILFISSSERRKLLTIFDSLRDASVLTIGECDQFTQQGGMIMSETGG